MTQKYRIARKPHICYECGNTIEKGDIYQITSGVWDGRPASFKWCDTCTTIVNLIESMESEIRKSLPRPYEYESFCFTFGNLQECIEELLRNVA